jgi:hypothetical protein
MILGEKSLISEVGLSQLVIKAKLGKTHIKASKNCNYIVDEERLARIRIIVSLKVAS